MAGFSGKVSLGNLDFAGAVNKLSEIVKNIEKNFDNALGLEENSDDAAAAAASSDSEEFTSNFQEGVSLEVLPTSLETGQPGSTDNLHEEKGSEEMSSTLSESLQPDSTSSGGTVDAGNSVSNIDDASGLSKRIDEENAKIEDAEDVLPARTQVASLQDPSESRETGASDVPVITVEAEDNSTDKLPGLQYNNFDASETASDLVTSLDDVVAESAELKHHLEKDANVIERLSSASNSSDIANSVAEFEKLKKETK